MDTLCIFIVARLFHETAGHRQVSTQFFIASQASHFEDRDHDGNIQYANCINNEPKARVTILCNYDWLDGVHPPQCEGKVRICIVFQSHAAVTSPLLFSREVFEQEAAVISEYLRGVHHSRKISHQQVNYSETVGKLGKIQSTVPVYLERRDEHNVNTTQGFGNTATGYKLKEFNDAMSKVIVEEKGMNDRKRLYNREVGRKAVVNKIIDGTAPNPKPFLFPQKATHTQILALTGTLKAPDARNLPPKVERGKKWLGDGVGWDS